MPGSLPRRTRRPRSRLRKPKWRAGRHSSSETMGLGSTWRSQARCSARSRGCTRTASLRERGSAWRRCSVSSGGMAGKYGQRGGRAWGRLLFHSPRHRGAPVTEKIILLVEDNQDDEELALLAFQKGHVANDVIVARDGVEALDYLFGTGPHAGRDTSIRPQVVLLDLNLPRIGGLDVLRRIRGDERTKSLAVVVLTSSKEDEDILRSYALGANGYVRKPVN